MTGTHRPALAEPTSWAFGLTSTAVMGVLPLIDDSSLDDRQRSAGRVATAVVCGLHLAITMGGRRLPVQAVVGLATAAATLLSADFAEAVDARIERRLRRVGLSHPRWWMAASLAGVTYAGFLGDRAVARRKQLEALRDDSPDDVTSPD